jgi:hypothetical protein
MLKKVKKAISVLNKIAHWGFTWVEVQLRYNVFKKCLNAFIYNQIHKTLQVTQKRYKIISLVAEPKFCLRRWQKLYPRQAHRHRTKSRKSDGAKISLKFCRQLRKEDPL